MTMRLLKTESTAPAPAGDNFDFGTCPASSVPILQSRNKASPVAGWKTMASTGLLYGQNNKPVNEEMEKVLR